MSTRLASEIYGLGSKITQDDIAIAGQKLPTGRQVLRSFMAHYSEEEFKSSASINKAAKKTFDLILPHYQKADMPMISEYNCIRAIKKLYELDYFKNIMKIPKNRREAPISKSKVEKFNEKLDKTFILWPKNCIEILRNRPASATPEKRRANIDEDLKFFESMKTDRLATYGGRDVVTQSLVKKKVERKRKLDKYYDRQREAACNRPADLSDIQPLVPDDVEEQSRVIEEEEFVPTAPNVSEKNDYTMMKVKKDFFKDPRLVSIFRRAKVAPAAQYSIWSTFYKVSKVVK